MNQSNSKNQGVSESLGYAASYLMYYWEFGNNNGGEKNGYKSVKKLLESSENILTLKELKINISAALKDWNNIAGNIDEKYPVKNSFPEIHTFCKVLIKILDDIIFERS